MLLSLTDLLKKYNIRPRGVIQVGAHFSEEHQEYVNAGVSRMVYIEPCAKAFEVLKAKFEHDPHVKLFNCACGDEQKEAIMYTGDNTINRGQSNSLLKPERHLVIHPEVEFDGEEVVQVELLDNLGLINKGYDFLNMDCQGYEGRVLAGGIRTLDQINYVYTELNFGPVYEGNTLVEEMDLRLAEFERVETGPLVGGLWTDGFYIRRSLLNR